MSSSVLERPTSYLETMSSVGFKSSSFAAASSNGPFPESAINPLDIGTGWGVSQDDPVPPSLSNVDLLERIHELSGLTWEQIARLFNVSRRSIHLWLAGGRLSSANELRLIELESMLSSWPGTAEDRRHQLLQSQISGRSWFDETRHEQASRDDDINRPLEPLPDDNRSE